AAAEGPAEHGDAFCRDRLGPQDSDRFVERTADDRAYVAECDLLRDRIHVGDAKVGVHDVDAERHLLDELDEGLFAFSKRAVRWNMQTDWVLSTIVHGGAPARIYEQFSTRSGAARAGSMANDSTPERRAHGGHLRRELGVAAAEPSIVRL